MNNIYKDIRAACTIVLSIFLVTLLIQISIHGGLTWEILKEQLFYNAYYGFPLTFAMIWVFDFINKLVSWDENPRLRAVIGILGTIVMTMVILIVLDLILWAGIKGKGLDYLFSKAHSPFYIIGFAITLFVTSIMHAIGFFKEVQLQKEISNTLRQQKLSSELNALRAHVDPHFLFNSFNVLSGLIDEDKDKAQTFLSGLSSIYRYVLEQRNEQTCTLEEELGFAKRYLELQFMRFENGIQLQSNINSDNLERKIPSLTLQLLLENAIKHNAFDAEDPLIIKLYVENDMLIITNNIRNKTELVKSNQVGLENIKDRYSILTEKKVDVIKNNSEFIVKLPLL